MKNYLRYVYAILAVSLAVLLRYALVPLIGPGVPYITLFPVTVSVALLAGMGPAILTGLLGSLITDYLFIPPLYTMIIDIQHVTRVFIVVLTSVFVGYIGNMLRAGRAKAEKQTLALTENEARLKRSQEIAHLGSWELDLVNNALTWSDEVYRIFGLQPQEFGATYEAFLERVHPDDRIAVNEAYSGSLREGRDTYEIEHRVIRKATGEIRYVHEKCEHIGDKSGRIIRSVGMVHDITERKQAEQDLVRAKEEWERTFDSVPDLIAIIDNHHRIIRINKAMAQRLGLDADKCVGLPCYKYVHGMDGPPEFCPHLHTLKDGCYHAAELHEERLGGDFLVTTNPLFNEQGKSIGSVHVARDITERKRAEENLKQSKESAEKLNRQLEESIQHANQLAMEATMAAQAKGEFLANMSHEIRTPMNAIIGFTNLLLKSSMTEKQKEYMKIIKDRGNDLLTLISDILDLSKIEADKLVISPVDFGLRSLIADVVATCTISTHEKGLALSYSISPEVPDNIVGDSLRLRQVLLNLVSNALKFTESGEISVKVEKTSLTERETELHFYVKDTGIGIHAEKQEAIFAPFTQADGSMTRKYGGTGLGLTISRRLIEKMGGRMWLESEAGKGSTFHFTLKVGLQAKTA